MSTFDVTVEGKDYTVDAPDANTAWMWANATHKQAGIERAGRVKDEEARTREALKAEDEARPWIDRARENLGAGMHSVIEGAQQLGAKVGLGEGVSDEQLEESRRIKEQLAERTAGGGIIQTVGEALPAAVIPGGAAATLGRAAATGAAGGAAAGLFQPTLSTESKLTNAAFGAAGGAAAPWVGKKLADTLLPKAMGGRRTGELGTRAGRELLESVGDQGDQVATALEAGRRGLTKDIPLTAAEKSGSTGLARLELAMRKHAPDDFADLARRQNEATYKAAKVAGREGTETRLKRLSDVRDAVTKPLRETALRDAGKYSQMAAPLRTQVDDLVAGSAAGSPQRGLADLLRRNLDESPSPDQLYELRKLLASKLSGPMMPGDEVAAITKGAQRETMKLIEAIDERINEAALRKGGAPAPWSDYLSEYAQRSKSVGSSRAQMGINEALDAAGRPMVGDAPEVTRHVLKQALGKHAQNKFGDKLTPHARGQYDELLGFLQTKEEPMRALKLGGTGGGGSQTAMQEASMLKKALSMAKTGGKAAASSLGLGVPFDLAEAGIKGLGAVANKNVQSEVAQMMLDPARAAAGIRAALRAGQPLSNAERTFLHTMRVGGAGAVPALAGAE